MCLALASDQRVCQGHVWDDEAPSLHVLQGTDQSDVGRHNELVLVHA